MKPLMLTKTEVYDLLTILRSRIETTKDNIAIRDWVGDGLTEEELTRFRKHYD